MGTSSELISLNPEDLNALPFASRKLWEKVESGKGRAKNATKYRYELTHQGSKLRQSLLNLTGRILGKGVDMVRNNPIFNNIMLGSYNDQLSQHTAKTVLSSHYMGLLNLPEDKKGVYLIPDIGIHTGPIQRLKENPNIKFISPFINTTKELEDLGISKDRIFNGMPREDDNNGNEIDLEDPRILITIGSDGPEIHEALNQIKKFAEMNVNLTVLCGPGIVNKKTIQSHISFRRNVDQIKLNFPDGDIEVIGGEQHWTREDHINQLFSELKNPNIRTVISRPNEMVSLSNLYDKNLVLLPPFQRHERKAYEHLIQNRAAVSAETFDGDSSPLERKKVFHNHRSIEDFRAFLEA